ncbi:hypothetical protein ACFX13_043134 [Malus domestica]
MTAAVRNHPGNRSPSSASPPPISSSYYPTAPHTAAPLPTESSTAGLLDCSSDPNSPPAGSTGLFGSKPLPVPAYLVPGSSSFRYVVFESSNYCRRAPRNRKEWRVFSDFSTEGNGWVCTHPQPPLLPDQSRQRHLCRTSSLARHISVQSNSEVLDFDFDFDLGF